MASTLLLWLLLATAAPAVGVAAAPPEPDGLDRGSAALEMGDRLKAWRHFEAESLERDPARRAAALAGVGIAAFGLGEYADAVDAFTRSHAVSGDARLLKNAAMAANYVRAEALLLRAPVEEERTTHAGVTLVTTFFRSDSTSPRRFAELELVLAGNAANAAVEALHVFAEGVDPKLHVDPEHAWKVHVVFGSTGPPTWGSLLRYASTLPFQTGVFVAHADNVFDESLSVAVELFRRGGSRTAFAITRRPFEPCLWESGGGHLHRIPVDLCTGPRGRPLTDGVLGYDAFGFSDSAFLTKALLQKADGLRVNRLGSDLLLVELLADAGLVVDPCVLVAARHVHCSQERRYNFDDDLVTRADVEVGRYTRAIRLATPAFVSQLSANALRGAAVAPVDGGALRIPLVAALPHSGETWLRFALENMTQTQSGSVTFDAELALTFSREGRCINVGFVVTHQPTLNDAALRECAEVTDASPTALLLLRDPLDVAAETYLHEALSHRRARRSSLEAAVEKIDPGDAAWRISALRTGRKWVEHVNFWRGQATIVRFEDLLDDTTRRGSPRLEQVALKLGLSLAGHSDGLQGATEPPKAAALLGIFRGYGAAFPPHLRGEFLNIVGGVYREYYGSGESYGESHREYNGEAEFQDVSVPAENDWDAARADDALDEAGRVCGRTASWKVRNLVADFIIQVPYPTTSPTRIVVPFDLRNAALELGAVQTALKSQLTNVCGPLAGDAESHCVRFALRATLAQLCSAIDADSRFVSP